MLKVSSVLVGVTDLNKAKLFYEKVFGMEFTEFRPPFASANLHGIEFNIEENADYRPQNWAVQHIGGRKQVSFKTDNLESFIDHATSHGAKLIEPITIQPWQYKEAVIADSDNNEWLIEQPI